METAKTLALETYSDISDFVLGALPTFGALLGIVAVFVAPLVWLARSVGAL